jgi:hypothetical protein
LRSRLAPFTTGSYLQSIVISGKIGPNGARPPSAAGSKAARTSMPRPFSGHASSLLFFFLF